MGKRLSENLSSLYIGAANKLKPKCSRRKIIAYVESYDDISFWRTLLGEYENETRYFEVMLPSKTTLAKGKKSVLMNELGPQLGQNMIACVDSDYDYLLQGATHTSRYIINNKYVFHTYAYAIENYQCYAEALHEVCVMATLNDHPLVDFVAFMRMYSQIAYPLFIWSVWFYRKHNLSEFSLLDFCSYVKLDTKVASDLFTLRDEPHAIGANGSRYFDNEGVATEPRTVFDKGVLKTYFIDTYNGKKMDIAPTISAPSRLILTPGDKDLNGLVADIKQGILVTGFNGGNSNSSTGDFSYGIEGFLIEDGKLTQPVNEMNVTGNMVTLWNSLVAVGNDPQPNRSWQIPSLVFEGVDFSGL